MSAKNRDNLARRILCGGSHSLMLIGTLCALHRGRASLSRFAIPCELKAVADPFS